MKKIYLFLSMAICAICMNAEGVDWYFVYDGNEWATDESTQFQTTDTENVYLLSNYQVTANSEKGGFNYQITNKSWSKMYGWCAEADGYDIVGSTYKLGNIGNAWINCESGTYNITFNSKEETIRFDLVSLGGNDDEKEVSWYFVYDGNSWVTSEETQLKKTDDSNVFCLKNYKITSDSTNGGISYQITNKDWTKAYGWSPEADGNDVVGSTYKLGNTGSAWLTCDTGIYNITFNSDNETILFEKASEASIDEVAIGDVQTIYYTIDGKIIAEPLPKGMYISKQGNKTSKVFVR